MLTYKYAPPRVTDSTHLYRSRLMQLFERLGERRRFVFIEAGAGQGKSVLAAQLAVHRQRPLAWFRMETEDNDPLAFITHLHGCFTESFSDYHCPTVQSILENREAGLQDVRRLTRLLSNALIACARKGAMLVLDDLHVLNPRMHGLQVLGKLLASSPSGFKVLVTSREAIAPRLGIALNRADVFLLQDVHLAFDLEETGLLLRDVLNLPVTPERVQQLHAATAGWVMGLVLSERVWSEHNLDDSITQQIAAHEHIHQYFYHEILMPLPESWHTTLMRWALLAPLPASLADDLSEMESGFRRLSGALSGLMWSDSALFGGERADVYRFHPLFQEYLRAQAEARMGEVRDDVLVMAARWYEGRGRIEEAVPCYLRARAYDAATVLLEANALSLLAENRLFRLDSWLRELPDLWVSEHPWLAFLKGSVAMELDPAEALGWLIKARQGFEEQTLVPERLMTLGTLLHYHWYTRPDFVAGDAVLSETEDLLGTVAVEQTRFFRPRLLFAMSLGYLYFRADSARSMALLAEAEDLIDAESQPSLKAMWLVGNALNGLFNCDWGHSVSSMEQCQLLADNPRTSDLIRQTAAVVAANILLARGDFQLYEQQVLRLADPDAPLMDMTVGNPFLLLWATDRLVASGRYDAARNLLYTGLAKDVSGGAHMRSQLLQYRVLLDALSGVDHDAFTMTLEETLTLRDHTGGLWFQCQARALLASACLIQGDMDRASGLLDEAEQLLASLHAPNLEYLILANRAFQYWRVDDSTNLDACIQQLLARMKARGDVYFYGCTGDILLPVLQAAVRGPLQD